MVQMFSTDPYFDFDGRQYSPHPHARGPWGTDTMHGRLLSGLMARQFEREFGEPAFQFTRLTVDLFRHAAMVADFTNPFANSGSNGLEFINADITLYLHRDPDGPWIGMETADHQSAAGIAIAECRLYDQHGPIGRSAVCAVANRRLRPM